MFIKRMLAIFVVFFSLVFLVGCSTTKITDFEGMSDITKKPKQIIYGTNQDSFNETDGRYGPVIEYEISNDKIEQIIEVLFSLNYKAYPKDTDIDLSPIINYIVLFDENGNFWHVDLGVRYHNERWYDPVNVNKLLDLLNGAKVLLKQGVYITEDKMSRLELFDENEFIFNRKLFMSYRPTGSYLVENGKLVLNGRNNEKFIFEIHSDYLVFISSSLPNELIEIGTIYRLEEENDVVLEQGDYVTSNLMSRLILYGDNEFIFDRHVALSYAPKGNYIILGNELILSMDDVIMFVFYINGDELTFVSGEDVESFIPVGTIFKLQE